MLPNVMVGTGHPDVNSSAPISGVVAFLVSPSMSTVMPDMGVAFASAGEPALQCKSVAEINDGLAEIELAS